MDSSFPSWAKASLASTARSCEQNTGMQNRLCIILFVAMTSAKTLETPVLPHTSATLVYVMVVLMTARAGVTMQQHAHTSGNVWPLSTSDVRHDRLSMNMQYEISHAVRGLVLIDVPVHEGLTEEQSCNHSKVGFSFPQVT